jgi:hypothetical protein
VRVYPVGRAAAARLLSRTQHALLPRLNLGAASGNIELNGVKQILLQGHVDLHVFVWIGSKILECSTDILDTLPGGTDAVLWNVFTPLNVLPVEFSLFSIDLGVLLALVDLAIVGGHD